jgi:hypothetical protein
VFVLLGAHTVFLCTYSEVSLFIFLWGHCENLCDSTFFVVEISAD